MSNAMVEAAFQYRSLYLLCTRSQQMASHLSGTAWGTGEDARSRTLAGEAAELAVEARKWYIKWQQAGGHKHAPLTQHLPIRPTPLAEAGPSDLTNVVRFPTERCRAGGSVYAC